MASRRRVALLALSIALGLGCERSRTRNSTGGTSSDDSEVKISTNVYRFVGVERAIKDARKAAEEERWGDALAAARALLAQEPGHVEAGRLAAVAELEGRSLESYTSFKKGLSDRSVTTIASSFLGIDAQSRYHEKARPEYERVREQWVVARESEARYLARAGRCKEAHKIARFADEMFEEMRARILTAGDNCNPASRQDVDDGPAVGSAPVASLTPVPEPPRPAPEPAPTPPPAPVTAAVKPAAVVTPLPAPVVVPRPAAPVPTPAAAPAELAKLVPAIELEKNRIAGDKRPALPAGARMIALRDNVGNIVVGLAFCLDTTGNVSSAGLVKKTAYDDANEKIIADVKKWKFKPYLVGGKPTPVCTRQIFIYQME